MNKSLRKRLVSILVLLFAMTSLFSTAAFASGEQPKLTPEEVEKFSSDELLVNQQAIEEAILAEYEQGIYTLKDPLITINPFGSAPLSALVIFDTEEETRIDLLVKGKSSKVDIRHSFKEYSTHHEIPVYGLYVDFNNTVTITTYTKNGVKKQNNISIKTQPLNDGGLIDSYNATIAVKNEKDMVNGLTFTIAPGKVEYANVVAFDANGDVRSVLTETGWVSPIRRLDNGRILVHSNKNHRGYFQMSFYEMDLMGKVYKEYLRNGVHHDVRKLANGNFLVVSEKAGREFTEDFIVELDGATGMKVREWDLREIFQMENYVANPYYNYNEHDWQHITSICPCPGEDAILISGRHQDSFFKLNLTTKKVVWVMSAPDADFSPELSAKLLKPIGDDFEYVWGQHAISMLPDGKIFVFDNGNGRSKDPNEFMKIDNPKNYSRAVIYLIDEKEMTVEQLWQYGKERGFELFGQFICDVDYLGPNHYLIDFGGAGYMSEGSYSKIIEIKDDVVVWEMKINANRYRAERMQAYEFDKEYKLAEQPGQQLGKLVITED